MFRSTQRLSLGNHYITTQWQKAFPRQCGFAKVSVLTQTGAIRAATRSMATQPEPSEIAWERLRQSRRKGIATLREKDGFMLWKGLLYLGI